MPAQICWQHAPNTSMLFYEDTSARESVINRLVLEWCRSQIYLMKRLICSLELWSVVQGQIHGQMLAKNSIWIDALNWCWQLINFFWPIWKSCLFQYSWISFLIFPRALFVSSWRGCLALRVWRKRPFTIFFPDWIRLKIMQIWQENWAWILWTQMRMTRRLIRVI